MGCVIFGHVGTVSATTFRHADATQTKLGLALKWMGRITYALEMHGSKARFAGVQLPLSSPTLSATRIGRRQPQLTSSIGIFLDSAQATRGRGAQQDATAMWNAKHKQ